MIRAGCLPFRTMAAESPETSRLSELLANHPMSSVRIRIIEVVIARLGKNPD